MATIKNEVFCLTFSSNPTNIKEACHSGDQTPSPSYPKQRSHDTAEEFNIVLFPYSYITYGKAIPAQVWTGHDGSRKLRLLDFMTIGT